MIPPPVACERLSSAWWRKFACCNLLPTACAGEVAPRLAELLAALTETQRIVLVRVLRGETWREVAAALGCSGANVAYHVRRIRRAWEQVTGEA